MESYKVFHAVVAIYYLLALYYDLAILERVPVTGNRSFGGRFKYLTFWNFLFQTFFACFSVLTDVFESLGILVGRVPMRHYRDQLLASVGFPLSMMVTLMFWSLYAIDRNLVYPPILDKYIPQWLNHVWHTCPLPLLIVETSICHHNYPPRRQGVKLTSLLALVYNGWIFFIAFYANVWVYGVLAVLSWPMRLVFVLVCWLLMFGCYVAGEKWNQLCCRSRTIRLTSAKTSPGHKAL